MSGPPVCPITPYPSSLLNHFTLPITLLPFKRNLYTLHVLRHGSTQSAGEGRRLAQETTVVLLWPSLLLKTNAFAPWRHCSGASPRVTSERPTRIDPQDQLRVESSFLIFRSRLAGTLNRLSCPLAKTGGKPSSGHRRARFGSGARAPVAKSHCGDQT